MQHLLLLCAITVISPVTKLNAAKWSPRLDWILSSSNLRKLFWFRKSWISPWNVKNSAQFLNVTCVMLSAVAVMSPVTKRNASK